MWKGNEGDVQTNQYDMCPTGHVGTELIKHRSWTFQLVDEGSDRHTNKQMLWGTFTEMYSTAEDRQQSLMNNAGVERGQKLSEMWPTSKMDRPYRWPNQACQCVTLKSHILVVTFLSHIQKLLPKISFSLNHVSHTDVNKSHTSWQLFFFKQNNSLYT